MGAIVSAAVVRFLLRRSGKTDIVPPLSSISPMTTEDRRNGYVLGPAARVLLCLWSLFLVSVFSLALWLEPDPRGFGTHQRLGLPPCTFKTLFSTPCPSCGMTTSFSNFARGRIAESIQANIAGFMLALACAVQIPWSWTSLYRGRLLGIERPDRAAVWFLGAILSVGLVQWALRVAFS